MQLYYLYLDSDEDFEELNYVLSEAEENGDINFPFDLQHVGEVTDDE